MRLHILFFIVVLMSGLVACQSPEQKSVLEQFKAVDSSLQTAGDSMRAFAKIKAFDTTGKNLPNVFDSARYVIYVLKDRLQKADPSGERLGVADSLLRHHPFGFKLYEKLQVIYSMRTDQGTGAIQGFHSELGMDPMFWLQQYFRGAPTIAAMTMLSKYRNDVDLIQSQLISKKIN